MITQISAETISLIVYQNVPVITTELLAQLYVTDTDNIKKNYSRNAGRFCEGKHFFKVSGEELKNLRVTLSHSQNPISPKTRSLILWTERGSARHAKMLETDQAWEVFEKLEDCYFGRELRPEALLAGNSQRNNYSQMQFNAGAITQLNLMFSCVEHLRMNMWPHLSAVFPGLNNDYKETFVKLAMMFSLLKKERMECQRKAKRIISGHSRSNSSVYRHTGSNK